VGLGPVPANAEVIAATQSQPLAMRLEQMMKHSDNVAAEAIAREVAAARGAQPSFASAAAATLDSLREAGHSVDGVSLVDNSGLSDSNCIPAAVLNELVSTAITDTPLRPLTGYLPVAAGEGTLQKRYVELSGRGFVRAKTGTLTGVSALSGTALGQSGRVYAFTVLVNDAEILSARAAQDNFASVLHNY
ncbi:MAG: D-alanyl-D-alanine carboxypeptidase/D-alanyl-D-alanine-endopeptidase, partial [Corynebacterium sp.]|nr:D-alanyl-D-alanine carboxypeptidase/D-alanyl-D-alanine-endopeptidase [Corynebacterium sp.]